MVAVYLDTSALVKMIILEPESHVLRRAATGWARMVSSEFAVVELLRVVHRQPPDSQSELLAAALSLLGTLALRPVTRRLLLDAGHLSPSGLRSHDAIHLATAIGLGQIIDSVVTYDLRLAEAARRAGLRVEVPQ